MATDASSSLSPALLTDVSVNKTYLINTELSIHVLWLPPLAAVLCGLLTIEHAWLRDHATSFAGPTLWNSLPEQLRQPDIS